MGKRLTDVDAVIAALGGPTAVAKLTNSKPQSVSNWRTLRRFPSNQYVRMKTALRELGLNADDSLWGMK